MSEHFKDQVAVITGAGEGIGFEIARQLAARGAAIVLNDVDPEKASRAMKELVDAGGQCLAFPGDVGHNAVVTGLIDRAIATFGRVDLAIANAGVTVWNEFLTFDPEDFLRVITVNLGGSFFLAQAAARAMVKRGSGGRILFMSSVTARRALPYLSAYSMTKAGLEGLARNLVAELSPHGITVNVVAPGATVTPRNLAEDPAYKTVWAHHTPTQRTSLPVDIAQAVLFLLSPDAAQITGQTLIVDGGWSAVSPSPALDFVETKKKNAP